jgi:hypothetical protein
MTSICFMGRQFAAISVKMSSDCPKFEQTIVRSEIKARLVGRRRSLEAGKRSPQQEIFPNAAELFYFLFNNDPLY